MRDGTRRAVGRLVTLVLGLGILGAILVKFGWGELRGAMAAADPGGVILAFAFFAPQVAFMAWRWQLVAAGVRKITFGDSCRMVLAGSALNVVLPSKLGDLCKGVMLGHANDRQVAAGVGLAGLDKLLDIAGLAGVLAVAGAVAPKPEPWLWALWGSAVGGALALLGLLHLARPLEMKPRRRVLAAVVRALNAAFSVRRHRGRWLGALGLSAALWACHVGQIHVFYRAVGGQAPAAVLWSRVPLAIFIGLLPLTLAGIGTRDAALLVLLRSWDAGPVIVWLGLFCTARYAVMGMMGVPAILSLGNRATLAIRQGADPDVPAAPAGG